MTQHLPQTPGDADDDPLGQDRRDRLLKSLRVSGHNAHTMAGAFGVHVNTIYNYLNGRTPMTHMAYIAWASVVGHGVTPEWLETGQGAHTRRPSEPGQAVGPATDRRDEVARKKRRARGFTDDSGEPDTHRYHQPLQLTG